MRILFLCSGSVMYGKENITLDVINGMKNIGHEVEVIFSGWHDGRFQKALSDIGVKAYPLKLGWYYITKPMWSIDSFVNYPAAIARFIRIVRSFKPDIIITDSFRNILLLRPFINNKVLFHVHDPHNHNKIIKHLLKLADSKIFKYISVSEYIKRDLIGAGINEDKIVVVHNGVCTTNSLDRTYMPNGVLRIGIVGQIIPRKGHEQLLRAVSLLHGKVDFEVHIFGSGFNDYILQLKQFISENNLLQRVVWHAFEPDKNMIFTKLDVLVAPAIADEPFGLTPVEAAMYKLPVIVYRSGGLTETVNNDVTGWIVEKFDYKGIAEKLLLLYNNSDMQIKMGNAAREFVLEKFTLDIMNEKINDIAKSAIS